MNTTFITLGEKMQIVIDFEAPWPRASVCVAETENVFTLLDKRAPIWVNRTVVAVSEQTFDSSLPKRYNYTDRSDLKTYLTLKIEEKLREVEQASLEPVL